MKKIINFKPNTKDTIMKVIFRACDKQGSVNGVPRPWEMDKKEVLDVCFRSLHLSLRDKSHEIHVIGDSLSEERVNFFKELEPDCVIYNHENIGNDNSILKSFELAETFDDEDIIYFCEDDYLHIMDGFYDNIVEFLELHRDHEVPFFIHPTDYPDQYNRLQKRSYIVASKSCHFREVSSSTFTFLTIKKNFMKYIEEFKKSSTGAQDGEFSKIFGDTALCFSPIPSLAAHLHVGTMPPYIPWDMIRFYTNSMMNIPQQVKMMTNS
tara:strand:- start:1877 stop:2674 length:798 start_codon:yes stop_codon:yes gene_type:complete